VTPDRWNEIERIYHQALEQDPAVRSVWLSAAANGDPAMEAEVRSLLEQSDESGVFMEEPAFRVAARDLAMSSVASHPTAIGRYRILRLLGEGGMGAVYEAEQAEPRRIVALKVIRLGLATPERLRRFRQESEALARLQHPGIAQIYESGTADSGFGQQPYFAMELIRGLSLHQYAATQRLDARQKLAIIAQICDAVHHAHQRGLIHRDLKPGNIIVDEMAQPKVLDFGVARVTEASGQDENAAAHTGLGQLVGTLAYMSPEQVLGDPAAIDARSDIYSLGVILYELLAGRLPYDIGKTGIAAAAQIIQQEDPPPLASIERAYRGDVDTIVRRALEKDKLWRYQSASDLGSDIRRHLSDQPIAARPPSTTYQLAKFIRRHRTLTAAVATVFFVLATGIAVSTSEAIRASRAEHETRLERDRALAAEQAANQERDRVLRAEEDARNERNRAVSAEAQAVRERNQARAETHRADGEADIAKAVAAFLRDDLLGQANPNNQAGPNTRADPDLTVRTALDRAAERIPGKFEKQPLVEAAIRQTIGNAYLDLGSFRKAMEQLEIAVDIRRRILGDDHVDTLQSMNNLSVLYMNLGDATRAEPLLSRILAVRERVLGVENADTLVSMNNLAAAYRIEGKYALAEPLLIKALAIKRRVLGEIHRSTAAAWNNLAALYRVQGRLAEAEPVQLKAVEVWRSVSGDEGPETLVSMNNLATLYQVQKRYAEAEALWTKVLESQRRVLGPKHPNTLEVLASVGEARIQLGKYAEAEAPLREVLGVWQSINADSWRRYYGEALVGASLAGQKRFQEAEPLLLSGYQGLLQRQTSIPAGTRRVIGEAGLRVGDLYESWGQADKAVAWREKLQAKQ
jgi:tetratricopeptide (TPR) repeat protein